MNYGDFIDILRLTDALLAAVVFGLLVNRGRLFWSNYDIAQKWIYASFTCYTLAVAYSSFELWVQHVDTGLRSYVILVANLIALYALWRWRTSIVLGQTQDSSIIPR